MSIDLSSRVTSDVVAPAINPIRQSQPKANPSGAGSASAADPLAGVRQVNASDGNILPGSAAQEGTTGTVDEATLSQAVSALNRHAQNVQRELEFKVDEELNRVIITVKDSQTEEVIRQIPPEEVVNMARHLSGDGSGVILKTQA
jgi:flagellar protein FlaG